MEYSDIKTTTRQCDGVVNIEHISFMQESFLLGHASFMKLREFLELWRTGMTYL